MDLILIIDIFVSIVLIYIFVRFLINPVLKIVFGVIIMAGLIYALNRFGFNFYEALGPLGKYIDLSRLDATINWILKNAGQYIDKIKSFIYPFINLK